MKKFVTDTQALVKYLNGKKVINNFIDSIFKKADVGTCIIVIPSVVLFEIGYLYEKHRIPISVKEIKIILEDSVNYRWDCPILEHTAHYQRPCDFSK